MKDTVKALPIINLADPKTYKENNFKPDQLFEMAVRGSDYSFISNYRGETNIYFSEYINTNNEIHLVSLTDKKNEPFIIRGRVGTSNAGYPSTYAVNVNVLRLGYYIIVYNVKKFIIFKVRRIDNNTRVVLKVHRVFDQSEYNEYPPSFSQYMRRLTRNGKQLIRDGLEIPQPLKTRVNASSCSVTVNMFLVLNGETGHYEYTNSVTGQKFILDPKCRWSHQHRDSEIPHGIFQISYSKKCREQSVIVCDGHMFPAEMVTIDDNNRELIGMYSILHSDVREAKFTLQRVTILGQPLVLYKEHHSPRTFFMYQYNNGHMVSRRVLYNAHDLINLT